MKHEKCTRCGWKYGNFHICLDIEQPGRVYAKPKPKKRPTNYSPVEGGRWQRERENNAERDQEILDLYLEGNMGYAQLAERFHMSQSTVQKVMKRAETAGKVVLRRRGATIAKGY